MSEVARTLTAEPLRRFKPYPAYKDSGVEWLGEIPAHWEVKRLKFAAHIEAGQSPPSEVVRDGLEGLPFLQGNADFGPISPSPRQVCDVAPKHAKEGDILLSVRAPVGAMNVADQDYGIGRGLCAVRLGPNVVRRFGFYALSATRKLLDRVATGSTYDAVTTSHVGDLPQLLPDGHEQRAIAAFLDRETARIDALVAKKERLIALLQEQRTALITRAVTKGLDPTVPMKDSGVEWLGEIPAHWEVKRNQQLLCIRHTSVGEAFGDYVLLSLTLQGVIRRDIESGKGKYPESFDTYQSVEAGDLVFCLFDMDETPRTVGIAREKGMVTGAYTVARCQPGVDPRYVCYLFVSFDDQKRLKPLYSGLRKVIRPELFLHAGMAAPSKSEQIAVADFLDRETARIDALIAKVREAIERLKELRTALISAAVTGKIDVREEVA